MSQSTINGLVGGHLLTAGQMGRPLNLQNGSMGFAMTSMSMRQARRPQRQVDPDTARMIDDLFSTPPPQLPNTDSTGPTFGLGSPAMQSVGMGGVTVPTTMNTQFSYTFPPFSYNSQAPSQSMGSPPPWNIPSGFYVPPLSTILQPQSMSGGFVPSLSILPRSQDLPGEISRPAFNPLPLVSSTLPQSNAPSSTLPCVEGTENLFSFIDLPSPVEEKEPKETIRELKEDAHKEPTEKLDAGADVEPRVSVEKAAPTVERAVSPAHVVAVSSEDDGDDWTMAQLFEDHAVAQVQAEDGSPSDTEIWEMNSLFAPEEQPLSGMGTSSSSGSRGRCVTRRVFYARLGHVSPPNGRVMIQVRAIEDRVPAVNCTDEHPAAVQPIQPIAVQPVQPGLVQVGRVVQNGAIMSASLEVTDYVPTPSAVLFRVPDNDLQLINPENAAPIPNEQATLPSSYAHEPMNAELVERHGAVAPELSGMQTVDIVPAETSAIAAEFVPFDGPELVHEDAHDLQMAPVQYQAQVQPRQPPFLVEAVHIPVDDPVNIQLPMQPATVPAEEREPDILAHDVQPSITLTIPTMPLTVQEDEVIETIHRPDGVPIRAQIVREEEHVIEPIITLPAAHHDAITVTDAGHSEVVPLPLPVHVHVQEELHLDPIVLTEVITVETVSVVEVPLIVHLDDPGVHEEEHVIMAPMAIPTIADGHVDGHQPAADGHGPAVVPRPLPSVPVVNPNPSAPTNPDAHLDVLPDPVVPINPDAHFSNPDADALPENGRPPTPPPSGDDDDDGDLFDIPDLFGLGSEVPVDIPAEAADPVVPPVLPVPRPRAQSSPPAMGRVRPEARSRAASPAARSDARARARARSAPHPPRRGAGGGGAARRRASSPVTVTPPRPPTHRSRTVTEQEDLMLEEDFERVTFISHAAMVAAISLFSLLGFGMYKLGGMDARFTW